VSVCDRLAGHTAVVLLLRLLAAGLPFGLTQGQISQIWHFLIALGLEIFGLAFWHFFGLIARVWP